MRLTDYINSLVHPVMVWRVMHAYAKKSRRVERKYPNLFRPVDTELSQKHKALWSKIGLKSGDRWLRLHVNLTGIEDYTFCPEDIFFSRIERILNDCNQGGYGPDDKCNLYRYIPKENEPETILRFVRGCFFDGKGLWINRETAAKLLKGEFVGKPCHSSGGNGVELRRDLTPEWIEKHGGDSYIVQKKIEQCGFTAQFNKYSINTIRMMTMRCPWNGKLVVCRSMLRMGVGDAVIDNMMKGGLCVCVGNKGQLGKYAYDYDGMRFERHPVSGLTFQGMIHPGYDKMVQTALSIHEGILDYNLLSFDLVQREDGSICVIEINATCQGITQLQYDFGGLFGEHSEKVIDWCSNHCKYDSFKHVRTWY